MNIAVIGGGISIGVVAGDPKYQKYVSDARLYLVCTNGNRDKCCAKFGQPVYEQVARDVGESAWQTTHIGGHRFAATIMLLPTGDMFG